jgi:hypothetical protein
MEELGERQPTSQENRLYLPPMVDLRANLQLQTVEQNDGRGRLTKKNDGLQKLIWLIASFGDKGCCGTTTLH